MKIAGFKYSITPLVILTLAFLSAGCPGNKPSPAPAPAPAPTTPSELGVTVRLVEHTGTDPEKPELRASTDGDHIRWFNETTTDRKIHFTVDWPFIETSGDFTVPAGAKSAWYTLDPAKVSGGGKPFPYEVTPSLASAPTDGPDAPEISGQP